MSLLQEPLRFVFEVVAWYHLVVLLNGLVLGLLAWYITAKQTISQFQGIVASLYVAQIPYYFWLADHPEFVTTPGVETVVYSIPLLLFWLAYRIADKKCYRKPFAFGVGQLVSTASAELGLLGFSFVITLLIPQWVLASNVGPPPDDLTITDEWTAAEVAADEYLAPIFNNHLAVLGAAGRDIDGFRSNATFVVRSGPLRPHRRFCWTIALRKDLAGPNKIIGNASYLINREWNMAPLRLRLLDDWHGFEIEVPTRSQSGERAYVALLISQVNNTIPESITTSVRSGGCIGT